MAGVSACAAPPTVSRAGIAGRQAVPRARNRATPATATVPFPQRDTAARERRPAPTARARARRSPWGPGPGMPAAVPTDGPAVAVSPAVGVFRPNADTTAGRRVRAGDRLGVVDVLGVPQEVVAPVDGILGEQLVNGGEAVEYGQDLVVIEFAEAPAMDG